MTDIVLAGIISTVMVLPLWCYILVALAAFGCTREMNADNPAVTWWDDFWFAVSWPTAFGRIIASYGGVLDAIDTLQEWREEREGVAK